ncbi:MAG TPA: Gldg family protein [Verrucomicrobiae bacterium]|nr:Gldg family protein [Verrucomicrobiae bacterium]
MRNQSWGEKRQPAPPSRIQEQGQVRTVVLAVVFFLLGAAVSILVYHNVGRQREGSLNSIQSSGLLESSKEVLQHLDTPVVIRYYSLLDAATVSDSTKAFAARVRDLLSEYEREGHGEIQVNPIVNMSDTNLDAAFADGLRPFNLEKGKTCYLGIVVSGNGQKETLPQLSTEWEGAVQFDLTRAIERVSKAKPLPSGAVANRPPSSEVVAEIKKTIPNLNSVSIAQGAEMLREAALADFAAAANQMEAQVKEAQQQLAQARKSGSAAEQQAAMKNLQQIQAAQADKIKVIAARLQDQIAALHQLKQP